MKETIVAWLYAIMMSISPIDQPHHIPEAQESIAQAKVRYQEIAESIYDVSFDEEVAPLFGGSKGRQRTALTLLAVTYFESGFRRDVDLGIGRRRLARTGWNDFGRSWCLGQVNLGKREIMGPDGEYVDASATVTPEGWSGPELVADRGKCLTAVLNAVKRSFGACSKLPQEERLAAYASGRCDTDQGRELSKARMRFARRLEAKHPLVLEIVPDPLPSEPLSLRR
jgi:hypothetical protein